MINGLYLVTDHDDRLLERVQDALSGGVRCLQYRNKVKDFGVTPKGKSCAVSVPGMECHSSSMMT